MLSTTSFSIFSNHSINQAENPGAIELLPVMRREKMNFVEGHYPSSDNP